MTKDSYRVRCPSCLSSNLVCAGLLDTWYCRESDCLWHGEQADLVEEGDFLDGADDIPELNRTQ